MHLLAARPGTIADGTEAVDLGQTPGEIVFLTAADTEIASLSAALDRTVDGFPTVRAANYLRLAHNLSVDLYVDGVIAHARLVVVRLLGGASYWPYGVERIAEACRRRGVALGVLPGDDQPDAELARLSTLGAEDCHRLWQYCVQGGPANMDSLLGFAAGLIGHDAPWAEPVPLLRAGLYWPGLAQPSLEDLRRRWDENAPVAALVFYRALVQAATLDPVDDLIAALGTRGLNPLPVFVHSLKEPVSAETVAQLLAEAPPAVIVNTTGFAVSTPGAARTNTPFDGAGCAVLQAVLAGNTEAAWQDSPTGLTARDIAMNVALPEVDGRIMTRAVSFKTEARFDDATQSAIVVHRPVADRIEFVAALAQGWARLAQTPAPDRRIAMVLANYPNKDGRIGNGVGLDTPAGAAKLLAAMAGEGYAIDGAPLDGKGLIDRLLAGPTNAPHRRPAGIRLALDTYSEHFERLPEAVRNAVAQRWGAPETDPFFADGEFSLAVHRFGNCVLAVQPARGYNIDPTATYHDPDLVPPHGYFAFYIWLRHVFGAHAVIHMGKHGNLEWLPGKSVALSEDCYPEATLGPLPHIYPFIVNDPGEGTQAKRRAAAVIVDHLTPPLARAESYGPLAELERLVDEYFDAAGVDPRRLKLLSSQILDLARASGLDKDCGIDTAEGEDTALGKLDTYLCELKEMQIRDGLHVFGEAPAGDQLSALLVALTRTPRGAGEGGDASLIRALAADLGLGAFDPLDCDMGAPWTGVRPDALEVDDQPWRTNGDTVERLELLASGLVSGNRPPAADWRRTPEVLSEIETRLRPAVENSGAAELDGALSALDGRFVMPGPSGAPTRGRPDVLPTGRNFYSVDTRAVPTPAAWQLGWASASLLVERYRQEHGAWPRRLAISAWGTANMRTGGDDIAQALALLGVQPAWDTASGRVTGFEIMPHTVLGRPRVDITFRLSGFFRDAFPAQVDLLDSAVRAVADLDEPDGVNPLAAQVRADAARLMNNGIDAETAHRRAGFRVFGSKPGAYGAGLQALIDERGWRDDGDLARAYIAWGGYAYGAGAAGDAEHRLFETRLKSVDAVVQNQDNREHDVLDSDDYYQFEGGIAAAVRHLSGRNPTIYHNDHSRPESPKIRTLADEIARTVRARVVNPKWIAGVMRHGYKGAFEMAATVDYLFAFAATARVVEDHHFDLVYEAYLEDATVRQFLLDNNPDAAREMAERLIEAQDRGLWRPRSNTAHRELAELAGGVTWPTN